MRDHNDLAVASQRDAFLVDVGGADETRTRDLRRDRHTFANRSSEPSAAYGGCHALVSRPDSNVCS